MGRWNTNVVYEPGRGFIIKMVREGPDGEVFELQGAIRPSANGHGYEAAVYPVSNERPLQLGQFCLYGEFGFKVEISGQWKDWLRDEFDFPQNLVWDFSYLNIGDDLLFSRVLIVYPNTLSWRSVISPLFIYGGLSALCFFQPEVGFPTFTAYRLTES